MTKEKYNGYKNRSTWLAVLHLDNTDKEVYDLTIKRAIEANTTKQFKAMITPILVDLTKISKENDFDFLQIDMREVWDHFSPQNN